MTPDSISDFYRMLRANSNPPAKYLEPFLDVLPEIIASIDLQKYDFNTSHSELWIIARGHYWARYPGVGLRLIAGIGGDRLSTALVLVQEIDGCYVQTRQKIVCPYDQALKVVKRQMSNYDNVYANRERIAHWSFD